MNFFSNRLNALIFLIAALPLLADGTGQYTFSHNFTEEDMREIRTADVDLDGDDDVIMVAGYVHVLKANSGTLSSYWYYNNNFLTLSTGVGDVNGDGYADLLIGASGADPAGETYVVFGKSGSFGSSVDLSALDGSDGFVLEGIDGSGIAVSTAGDVNGDGYADILIGAYRPNSYAGETYLVFGKSESFDESVDLG